MLPKPQYRPALLFQVLSSMGVSSQVGFYLRDPPIRVVLGRRPVLRTAVPETTVKIDGNPGTGKADVDRPSSQVGYGIRNAESKAPPMKRRANCKFARIISPASRTHTRRSARRWRFGALGATRLLRLHPTFVRNTIASRLESQPGPWAVGQHRQSPSQASYCAARNRPHT